VKNFTSGERAMDEREAAVVDRLTREVDRALTTLKLAYRHVVLGDPDVASGEMGDELGTTLAQLLGDEAFRRWLQEVSPNYD
jgi:hypothetical protein